MLRLIQEWIVEYTISLRWVCCRSLHPQALGEIFRVDAKAEGNDVVLGGWCVGDEARWFSLRLDPSSIPWVTEKETCKVIASLELLVAVMVFVPHLPPGVVGHASFGCSAVTDNKGTASVVQRHMYTKFPLCTVSKELSSQLAERGPHLGLGWLPRKANRPVDSLTNSDFSEFSPEKHIEVQWTDLKFKVLDRLMVRGPVMLFQIKAVRESKRHAERARDQRGRPRRRQGRLRKTAPW